MVSQSGGKLKDLLKMFGIRDGFAVYDSYNGFELPWAKTGKLTVEKTIQLTHIRGAFLFIHSNWHSLHKASNICNQRLPDLTERCFDHDFIILLPNFIWMDISAISIVRDNMKLKLNS